jgi:hypothetical protein
MSAYLVALVLMLAQLALSQKAMESTLSMLKHV